MDKLQLGCQSISAIGIGIGVCDSMEVVVVVGSGSVSGSSDSNIHTQLLLQFTTVVCTMRCKDTCSEMSSAISFPKQGM